MPLALLVTVDGVDPGAKERRTLRQGQVHCCTAGDDERARAEDRPELAGMPVFVEAAVASVGGGAKLEGISLPIDVANELSVPLLTDECG